VKLFLKKLYRGATKVARIIGIPFSIAILTLFYFVGIGLTALFARIFVRDLLPLKFEKRKSYLRVRPPDEPTIETVSRQH
jgi:hypothetical protein